MAKTLQKISHILKHTLDQIAVLAETPSLMKDSESNSNNKYNVEETYSACGLKVLNQSNPLFLDATLVQAVLLSSNEDSSIVLVFGSRNWLATFGLRLVSCTAPVNRSRLVSGNLWDTDWPLITEAVERYRHRSIYFAQGYISIKSIDDIARRKFAKTKKVKSIVIDYQCLTESRQQFQDQLFVKESYLVQLEKLSRNLNCSILLIDVAPRKS